VYARNTEFLLWTEFRIKSSYPSIGHLHQLYYHQVWCSCGLASSRGQKRPKSTPTSRHELQGQERKIQIWNFSCPCWEKGQKRSYISAWHEVEGLFRSKDSNS